MSYRPPFQPNVYQPSDAYDRSGTILGLIEDQGRIAAEGAQRSGDIWSRTIGTLGNLGQQFFQHKAEENDQKQAQQAITAATTSQSVDPNNPNAGIESIIASVPPEKQDHVRAAIEANRASAQKLAQATQAQQQAQADHWGTFGLSLKEHLDNPDGGIHLANNGLSAFRGLPGASDLAPVAQAYQQAFDSAPDDATKQAVVARWREAVTPKIDAGAANMSLDAQKTWAEAQKNLAEAAKASRPPEPKPPNLQHIETAEGIRTFDPATGQVGPVIAKNKPTQAMGGSGLGALYGEVDPKAIAEAIKGGQAPPDISQYGRPASAAIASELAKGGFNIAQAQTDWKATQKHISTLNGAQMTRMTTAIDNASHSLDVIDGLADQWKGGSFPILNKANLAIAKSGGAGKEAQALAVQLEAQIADVTSELGNVYMGGNSPTDHALGLAAKNLSADWSKDTLKAMTKLARTNLQIRSNSISNSGVTGASAGNPYAAPAAQHAAPEVTATGPGGQKLVLRNGAWVPAQ